MKNLWTKYLAWVERIESKRLGRWGRIRAKGKVRHVLLTTAQLGGLMIASTFLLGLYDHTFRAEKLPSRIVVYLCLGLLGGLFSWSYSECEYRNWLMAKRDRKHTANGGPAEEAE